MRRENRESLPLLESDASDSSERGRFARKKRRNKQRLPHASVGLQDSFGRGYNREDSDDTDPGDEAATGNVGHARSRRGPGVLDPRQSPGDRAFTSGYASQEQRMPSQQGHHSLEGEATISPGKSESQRGGGQPQQQRQDGDRKRPPYSQDGQIPDPSLPSYSVADEKQKEDTSRSSDSEGLLQKKAQVEQETARQEPKDRVLSPDGRADERSQQDPNPLPSSSPKGDRTREQEMPQRDAPGTKQPPSREKPEKHHPSTQQDKDSAKGKVSDPEQPEQRNPDAVPVSNLTTRHRTSSPTRETPRERSRKPDGAAVDGADVADVINGIDLKTQHAEDVRDEVPAAKNAPVSPEAAVPPEPSS